MSADQQYACLYAMLQQPFSTADTRQRPVGRDEFTIAIICALPLEADAVYYMFDEMFPNEYHKTMGDTNHYTNGRIGKYNVVLALLPSIGKAHAAGAAASLNASYTNLRLALLVGICGGVPGPNRDGDEVLLGDVIISNALVQFDFGRRYPDGLFLRKTSIQENLGRLNKDLRSLLRSLETERRRSELERRTAELLRELQISHEKEPLSRRQRRRRGKYDYPGTSQDKLFEAHYRHRHRKAPATCCSEGETCDVAPTTTCEDCDCDNKYLIPREQLDFKRDLEQHDPMSAQEPMIYIGSVASGDTVMKSGEDRDRIVKEENVLAFEMEGAGVWDEIPCIVIKGVSDYADNHKHKIWQDFAAATAAATMKALVEALVGTEKSNSVQRKASVIDSLLTSMTGEVRSRITQQLACIVQQQTRLGMQMPLYLILVVDARGRNLPFHLETITSRELFIHVLKSRFMDLGTRKIDRGEWYLEDRTNGKRLDLTKPWQSIFQPYQVLKMSMVFRRRKESYTQCPSCQFQNPGIPSMEMQCCVCGLTYRLAEESQNIQLRHEDTKTLLKSKSNAAEQPRSLFQGPVRPEASKTPDPEDDISRYKHVQMINVDIKFDPVHRDQQLSNQTLFLCRSDLTNLDQLAKRLASTYGFSEVDRLAASEIVIKYLSEMINIEESTETTADLSDCPIPSGPTTQDSTNPTDMNNLALSNNYRCFSDESEAKLFSTFRDPFGYRCELVCKLYSMFIWIYD